VTEENTGPTWRRFCGAGCPLAFTAFATKGLSDMPRVLPLLHPLDGPATATTPVDPLAAFHHPKYAGVQVEGTVVKAFLFRPPFTGFEDRPRRPLNSYGLGLDKCCTDFLNAQYAAALTQWSRARLHDTVRRELAEASSAWSAVTAARADMDRAFETLRSAPDNHWRAQTLRLLDLHTVALAAAKDWDQVATRLARAQDFHDGDLIDLIGRLMVCDVARELGADDADSWEIEDYRDYTDRWGARDVTPMVAAVATAIETQKQALQEVNTLVGQAADATLRESA
jgi:hypothetical protein